MEKIPGDFSHRAMLPIDFVVQVLHDGIGEFTGKLCESFA